MWLGTRLRQLDAVLLACHDLWHPQPFRDPVLSWMSAYPALHAALQDLDETEVEHLNDDCGAALTFLATHVPMVAEVAALSEVAPLPAVALPDHGARWAWEIPGRKRAQIEAFAAAAQRTAWPILDWCGGKGHLGRLLALDRGCSVETLEIDAALCQEGRMLAARQDLAHHFTEADALQAHPSEAHQGVALHACGELHRRLVQTGAAAALPALDVAPCCYYRGVTEIYAPLSPGRTLQLTRDDTRLAVTETVTASPRLARQRDKEMAWKLGYDAFRRTLGMATYRSFKPVPAAWFRGSFADFLRLMAARDGWPTDAVAGLSDACERAGWQRQHALMRDSIVRHAFRRALEVWLVGDLADYLADRGYRVQVGTFCPRYLTPRNLLLSARWAG